MKARSIRLFSMLLACVAVMAGTAEFEASAGVEPGAAVGLPASAPVKHRLDLSGKRRIGKASYYAKKFTGRKMADGTRMDPRVDNAASKTLPLGTTAKVTNLETGQSAVVTIQDRGPYVEGRIVDLSPSTAQKIGITREEGVAKVEVEPIMLPLPNGGVKNGAVGQGKGANR